MFRAIEISKVPRQESQSWKVDQKYIVQDKLIKRNAIEHTFNIKTGLQDSSWQIQEVVCTVVEGDKMSLGCDFECGSQRSIVH